MTEKKRIAQNWKSQRSVLRRIGVSQNPYDTQRGPGSNQSSYRAVSEEKKLQQDTDLCFVSRKLITAKRNETEVTQDLRTSKKILKRYSPEHPKNARICDRSNTMQMKLISQGKVIKSGRVKEKKSNQFRLDEK